MKVFYDGACGVCRKSVAWIEARDRHGRVTCRPSDTREAQAAIHAHGLDGREQDTLITVDGDQAFTESAAVVRILWRLGGLARFQGALLWLVPKPLRDAGYRHVARNR